MKYEDALKVWGASKLRDAYRHVDPSKIKPENVTVEMDFNEGNYCCGGYNEDCYCSMLESASASVVIKSGWYHTEIAHYSFDFSTILGEIVAAGDGKITE